MKNYYLFTVCIFSFLMVSCSKPVPKILNPEYITQLNENELHKFFMEYSKIANKKSEEEYYNQNYIRLFFVLMNCYQKLWAKPEFNIQFYDNYLRNAKKGNSDIPYNIVAVYAFIEYIKDNRKDLIKKLPSLRGRFWQQARFHYFDMPVKEYIYWLLQEIPKDKTTDAKIDLLEAVALSIKDYNLAIWVSELRFQLLKVRATAGSKLYKPYMLIIADIARYSLKRNYITDKDRRLIVKCYSYFLKEGEKMKKYHSVTPFLKKRMDCILATMKKFDIKVTKKDIDSVIQSKTMLNIWFAKEDQKEFIDRSRAIEQKIYAEFIAEKKKNDK